MLERRVFGNEYSVCVSQGIGNPNCTSCLSGACNNRTSQGAMEICANQCSGIDREYAACVLQGNGNSNPLCTPCLGVACNNKTSQEAIRYCDSQCSNEACDPSRWTCNGNIATPPCNARAPSVDCSLNGKTCNPNTGLCEYMISY